MDILDYLPDRYIKSGDVTFLDDLLENPEIKTRLDRINSEIEKHLGLEGEPKILYDTAKHLLKAGGKRLRSLLVILSCEAVGGDMQTAMPYAVATELAQTASLIHDDIIDEDTLRRGTSTTHEKFGHKMAILAGDLLIAQAVRLVGEIALPDLVVRIAEEGIRMCEGEAEDMLLNANNPQVMNLQNYFQMIDKKTVSFIRAAVVTGGTIGKGQKEQIDALRLYGEKLGVAFQIRDDVLNVISPSEVMGKNALNDLLARRCTFPLVFALDKSDESNREHCLNALSEGNPEPALHLIDETQAIQHAKTITEAYVTEAKSALEGKGFNNISLLNSVAEFVLKRLH